jgi:protein-disulfide isomerase
MSEVGRKPDEARVRPSPCFGRWAGVLGAAFLTVTGSWSCALSEAAPEATTPVALSAESRAPQPSSPSLPINADDIRWGNTHAPVTIVAFLDFECPFCAQVHTTLGDLLTQYGPDKIRLVVKHAPLPFHKRGVPAAKATQAIYRLAGAGALLAYVERVFEHPEGLTDQTLIAWANELGVAEEDFRKEFASPSVQAKVLADLGLSEAVGVSGVPAFYINGAPLVGARPKADFVAIIEHELRASEELLRRGVAPGDVFGERVAVNWVESSAEPPPYENVAYQVPIGTSPTLGLASAAVTIVEFADFECPFCEQAHKTVEALMRKYPGQVRWVMKHNPLPFHPLAKPAAITALEVRRLKGEAAYWTALRRFYAAERISSALLDDVAREFGVSSEDVTRLSESKALPAQLSADFDLAMDLNAMGTPQFFVNGIRLAGAQPMEVFEQLVQQQLQKVSALGAVAEPYAVLQANALPPVGLVKQDVPKAPATSPTLGPAGAEVVIQMFADFECGYCMRVLPTLADLRARYPGKIKLVWRHLPLPFHKNAKRAAAAALEAQAQLGPQGFWRMAEKLIGMPNAFEENAVSARLEPMQVSLAEDALQTAARELELDHTRFILALDRGVHAETIALDEELARALGVQGTPSFFVGPYALAGAQPLPRFDRLVRRVLEEAKQYQGVK